MVLITHRLAHDYIGEARNTLYFVLRDPFHGVVIATHKPRNNRGKPEMPIGRIFSAEYKTVDLVLDRPAPNIKKQYGEVTLITLKSPPINWHNVARKQQRDMLPTLRKYAEIITKKPK